MSPNIFVVKNFRFDVHRLLEPELIIGWKCGLMALIRATQPSEAHFAIISSLSKLIADENALTVSNWSKAFKFCRLGANIFVPTSSQING